MNRKISEIPEFSGQKLLLEAQRRGIEILTLRDSGKVDATSIMLIGLANILVDYGIIPDGERRKSGWLRLHVNEERRNEREKKEKQLARALSDVFRSTMPDKRLGASYGGK